MTSPKKKSGSKAGGKSKPTAASPGSAKGSGKSASRNTGRRGKKSGKSGVTAKHIGFAFVFGLLIASAFFLMLRPEAPQGPKSVQSVSRTEKGVISKSTLPRIPGEKTKKPVQKTVAQKEEAGKKPVPAASGAVESRVGEKTPESVAAEKAPVKGQIAPITRQPALPDETATAPLSGGKEEEAAKEQKTPGSEDAGKAVASALVDLRSLPYEESLSAHIQDQARQVDYALIQAARLKKLSPRAMRQVKMEGRTRGKQHYYFQVIEILPGQTADAYVRSLEECLAAWAEKAQLRKGAQKNQWAVWVNGVQTHVLRLYPEKKEFPPLSATTAGPGPEKNLEQARVRQPGEAARLVIVMDDLGANSNALRRLMSLDFPVTFAFWPHGAYTREGARAAHAAGHEILVHQPMEPLGYPRVKPGPNVLRVGMNEEEIRAIVASGLEAVPFAVGLNNHMGSRFTQFSREVDTVLYVLRDRGLFMLDSVTHGRSVFWDRARRLGVRHYRRSVFLDVEATRAKVLAQLKQAERIALLTGQAVAIGHPLPETLDALREWQKTRNKDVSIVRLRDLEQE